MQLGLEALLREGGYGAYSTHFDAIAEDGRFARLPLAAASSLMAKGYGYGAEGDALTAALMAAGRELLGDTQFTEMYAMDFPSDSILMSHMGEGNWALARDDRPVRLIKRPLGIGGLGDPPTFLFQYATGPVTLATLVSLGGERFRLLVSEGEILDTDELPALEMPYGFFRPDSGVRECMNAWLRLGGPHHQVLNPGRQARGVADLLRAGGPGVRGGVNHGRDHRAADRRAVRAAPRAPAAGGRRRSAPACARGRSAARSCWPASAPASTTPPSPGACSSRGPTGCATGATRSTAPSTAWSSPSPSAATRCTASCCRAAGGACAPRRAACRSPTSWRRGRAIRSRWRSSVSYELASGGVVMTLHATNVGAERAPFGAGLHPYLTPGTTDVDDMVLEIPARHARAGRRAAAALRPGRRRSTGPSSTSAAPRRLGALRVDACFGELGRSPAGVARVRLGTNAGAGQLTVWMDERFRFVQVFTADAAIAVEPMTCAPDAFNSGDGLVVLEPGASFTGRCGLIAAGF